MAQAQVAVRIARYAMLGSRLDQRSLVGQGTFGKRLEPFENGVAGRRADLGCALFEVLPGVPGNDVKASAGSDLRPRLGVSVESGDPARQIADHVLVNLTSLKIALQAGLVGQTPHLHRPFDDLAIGLETDAVATPRDRHDTQIDVGRQPAIEPHFLVTKIAAFFQ